MNANVLFIVQRSCADVVRAVSNMLRADRIQSRTRGSGYQGKTIVRSRISLFMMISNIHDGRHSGLTCIDEMASDKAF
nr:hypothetical protein CFP56_00588 [Quercus suber]